MDLSLANVFLPATETLDPQRFAGRKDKITTALYALASSGVHIILYGERGVGKSSLARQIEFISKGDNRLLERIGIDTDRKFDFHTIYFTCDDSITNLESLLKRLMTDPSGIASWVPYRTERKSQKYTSRPKFDIQIVSLEGAKETQTTEIPSVSTEDIFGLFKISVKNALSHLKNKDGLLVILDEFDRIGDSAGLASLIKSMSSEKVTFLITGTARNIYDLVRDHESIGRQLAGGVINLPPMSSTELNEIFDTAEKVIKCKYSFDESARLFAIYLSRGHPFYVHLLGKHSLLQAQKECCTIVTEEIMKKAWNDIASSRAVPIQEDFYHRAVGFSCVREGILKRLALLKEDVFLTSNVYSQLARTLKVSPSTISKHVRHLCIEFCVLEQISERHYRFRDSLFKTYAAARPFLLTAKQVR